jgi:hypothetical protein
MPSIDDAFPSRYLKTADLGGRRTHATIDTVSVEVLGRGREAKPKLVIEFVEAGLKSFVCNKTNALTIARLAGTKNYDEWTGLAVTLVPTTTSFGSEIVDCVRVESVAPKTTRPKASAPEPNLDDLPVPEPPADLDDVPLEDVRS